MLMASQHPGAYGSNSPARHVTGRLGELGTLEWLALRCDDVRPRFRYTASLAAADILVGGWAVEVKAWRESSWLRFGPALAPTQLPAICAKADAIVLCTVPDGDTPEHVTVLGWLTPQEALTTGSATWTSPERADLNLDGTVLRPMLDLVSAVDLPPPPRLTTVAPAMQSCGHVGLTGWCWVCATPGDGARWVRRRVDRTGLFHRSGWAELKTVHEGVSPFAWSTELEVVPLGQAVLDSTPCGFCFADT